MSTLGGPYTERNGLVFGMDTGYGIAGNNTSTRFYSGRNTINFLSDGISGYNVVQSANWNGATPSFTLGTSEFGTPIGSYNTSGTSYMYSHDFVLDDDLSTLSSQSVTFSIYLKRDGVDSNVRIRIYDNISGYTYSTKSVTSEFSRYTMTKTLGANPTRIFVMIDNTGGGVIDFHSPMLQIGDVTPFVDGTRSSTQSLIDLTKTSNIDVSNVSFDSTGQPTFDGTDDYINKIRNQYAITDNWSVEVIFKPTDDSDTSWNGLFGGNLSAGGYWMFHSSGKLTYYEGSDGTTRIAYRPWTKANTFNQNVYHHLVITYTSTGSTTGTFNLYYNGGEKTDSFNWTFTFSHSLDSNYIGMGGGNRFGTNDIQVYKEFNRVLTPAEIQKNYNAYKNRFNL